MSSSPDGDVLVIGGGPAGRALAAACAGRGLRTTLLDPDPERPWPATYGAWAAELPAALPASAVAARARGRAIAVTERELGWEYAVLDVAALRAHLDTGMDGAGVTVRAGRAVASPAHGGVLLADGSTARARVVVDAAGHRRPGATGDGRPAEQTAYGLVVDEAGAAPFIAPGDALFMDWRPDHGEPGWPTFLYAVPLGGGSVLLEETSLARRPGLPLRVLRRRLLSRLAAHGVTPAAGATVEEVRFRVDAPRHRGRGALGYGAAAPLVHPASGFSVATALRLAPAVADAIATAAPGAELTAAQEAVWPASARAVHRLRRIGLEALLRMPPDQVPGFFEVFLGLPPAQRWAYLTGRDDLRGTVAAMRALYRRAGWELRGRLIGPAFLPPLRANTGPAPSRTSCVTDAHRGGPRDRRRRAHAPHVPATAPRGGGRLARHLGRGSDGALDRPRRAAPGRPAVPPAATAPAHRAWLPAPPPLRPASRGRLITSLAVRSPACRSPHRMYSTGCRSRWASPGGPSTSSSCSTHRPSSSSAPVS